MKIGCRTDLSVITRFASIDLIAQIGLMFDCDKRLIEDSDFSSNLFSESNTGEHRNSSFENNTSENLLAPNLMMHVSVSGSDIILLLENKDYFRNELGEAC